MDADILKYKLLSGAHWRLQQQFQEKAGPALKTIITSARVVVGTVVDNILEEWPFPKYIDRKLKKTSPGIKGFRYQDTDDWDTIKTIFLNDKLPVLGECNLWLDNGGPLFQLSVESITPAKMDLLAFSEEHDNSPFAVVGAQNKWGLIVDFYHGKDGKVFEYCRWGNDTK